MRRENGWSTSGGMFVSSSSPVVLVGCFCPMASVCVVLLTDEAKLKYCLMELTGFFFSDADCLLDADGTLVFSPSSNADGGDMHSFEECR